MENRAIDKHSDRKASNILVNMLMSLPKSNNSTINTTVKTGPAKKNRTPKKLKESTKPQNSTSPIVKRLRKKNISQSNTLNTWITKESQRKSVDKCSSDDTKYSQLYVKIAKESIKKNSKKECMSYDEESECKRQKLNVHIENGDKPAKKTRKFKENSTVSKAKKSKKKTKFTRNESSDSFELPTIKLNKESTRDSESFKKYGIKIPTIEEMLRFKKEAEEYRAELASIEHLDEKYLNGLPFRSIKDIEKDHEEKRKNLLGCKHLSIDDLTKAFKENLSFASDIFHGIKYSERHQKFHNNNRLANSLSIHGLCYSTTMMVFTYEQMDHLITLLEKEFDPEDKHSKYFFQVLLPELCLKIFMDSHKMTYDEAVKYLEERPVD